MIEVRAVDYNVTAIRIDALVRTFGALRAVDELTLEVPAGIIFGFLGPNGAGKTTTINLLLGLLEPTSGRAEVLGFDPCAQGKEVRGRTGAVLEHTGVYEQLSVEENLEFYGRAWRIPTEARRARIRELLSAMDLWERRREKAGTWSRGMQQRLALARALLHRPSLLFLDEPTAGLDVMAAASVRDDLAALARTTGATVFLTTHNMTEAERLCSVVAVIRAGRVVAIGSPEELRARTGTPRVEIAGRGFDTQMLGELRTLPEVAAVQRSDGHLLIDLAQPTEPAPIVGLLVRRGALVGEVEDARVEYKAIQAFPGLKKLWRSLLVLDYQEAFEHDTIPILEKFALQLLDASYQSNDAELNALAERFHAGIEQHQDNNQFSWDLGMELFHLFMERREVPSLRILNRIRIPYRVDNRYVWEFEEFDWDKGVDFLAGSQRQVRRKVSIMEMANEVDCELAGDDAQEISGPAKRK